MPKITFEVEGNDTVVELSEKLREVTIGRNAGNVLRIVDRSISRSHAKITFHDDHCVIEDLGSANGSYVNEEKISRAILVDGDVIRCGDFELGYADVISSQNTLPLEKTALDDMMSHDGNYALGGDSPSAEEDAIAPSGPMVILESINVEQFRDEVAQMLVAIADDFDMLGEHYPMLALAFARMRHLRLEGLPYNEVDDRVQQILEEEFAEDDADAASVLHGTDAEDILFETAILGRMMVSED